MIKKIIIIWFLTLAFFSMLIVLAVPGPCKADQTTTQPTLGRKVETLSQIRIDENGSLLALPYPYLCKGKFHWLHGRNIQDRPITEEEWDVYRYWIKRCPDDPDLAYQCWADELFYAELDRLEAGIIRRMGIDTWKSAPKEIQIIILNMAYNMGSTRFSPSKWPFFWQAFAIQDWERCAWEMMYVDGVIKEEHTSWYKTGKSRSERLVATMLSLAQ